MSDPIELAFKAIEEEHADASVATRRKFVAGAAGTFASLGLLALPGIASAHGNGAMAGNDPQTILNVATTAEVLATIVNTVGWEKGLGGDAVTQRNIKTAAREELIHFRRLVKYGGKSLAYDIWVPDAVFASRTNLLNTLQVGDQIFVNAYLIATKTFGAAGNGDLATVAAEFMGVEAVHRALARQSLGLLGNDRAFMKFDQPEMAPGAPNRGQRGFTKITDAAAQLQAAGFGFGHEGAKPGRFYSFKEVAARTPDDPDINTRTPDTD